PAFQRPIERAEHRGDVHGPRAHVEEGPLQVVRRNDLHAEPRRRAAGALHRPGDGEGRAGGRRVARADFLSGHSLLATEIAPPISCTSSFIDELSTLKTLALDYSLGSAGRRWALPCPRSSLELPLFAEASDSDLRHSWIRYCDAIA